MNRKISKLSILSTSTLQSNIVLPLVREPYDYLCKVIVIGPSGSGKTSLLRKFLEMDEVVIKQTIGVEFHSKVVTVEESTSLKLQLWDTAGQERFKSLTTSYYRGSSGVVLCFDLSVRDSLAQLERDLQDVCDLTHNDTVTCLVVGTKSDLPAQVFESDVSNFVHDMRQKFDMDISTVYSCSSQTGENVDQVFETIANKIVHKIEVGIIDIGDVNSGVQLGNTMVTNSESAIDPVLPRNNTCCY